VKRPIRVLHFSTLYPSSVRPTHGIFVETRLRELGKSGRVDSRVVAPVPWFPWSGARWGNYARYARTPSLEVHNGMEVYHPRYLLPPRVGMTMAPVLLAIGAAPRLRALRSEGFDFDLIDAHYYYPDGVAAALLGRWFRRPVTVTARGSDINLIPSHRLPRAWMRWAATRVAASIGVSAALVDRMRALHFDTSRLHVMRNGVDLDRFRPLGPEEMRRELGIAGAPVLLTVGNLHEYKGQRLALEALASLRRGRHPQAQLLIIGEGPDEQYLRGLARSLDVAEAVRWVGTVPNAELCRWYSAADVLILASSREGWPNVLLEAMACGTPAVASRVGGVVEIIRGAIEGRVVTHRHAEAFAAAIAEMLAAPSDRRAVRAHAAEFSWERTTQDQLGLFEALAAGD
jgi:glycosyltransferase involved in cell wall biosynthesis